MDKINENKWCKYNFLGLVPLQIGMLAPELNKL